MRPPLAEPATIKLPARRGIVFFSPFMAAPRETSSSAPSGLLSSLLMPLLGKGFFRPLSRPSAPVYIDCADRLAASADEGGQLAPDDALALIRDVLGAHPSVELDQDEGAGLADLRLRAGQFYNRMLEAGWLIYRPVNLDERWVLLSPHLRPLLRLLRELSQSDLAELKDFSATVRSICETLLSDGALSPSRREPDELRQVTKELLARLARAGDQMHAVETLIFREEERQRASASAGETLQRFLVEFHEGEHMVCYDALEKAGLLPKLKQARLVVQDALADSLTKQRLAEGLAAHHGMDEIGSYTVAERMLSTLEGGLAAILAKQRIVDGRIADFSRLSAARYRYQTELRGRRPEQVRKLMQAVNKASEGRTFADFAAEPGFTLLSPEVELCFGRDALSRPRRARPPVDLSLAEPPASGDLIDAQSIIRRRTRDAITPQRAVRLIESLLPERGEKLSTADFHLNSDDFLDLLAALAFEQGNGVTSSRPVKWRVLTQRTELGLTPEALLSDEQGGHRVERITLERIE